MFAVAVATHFHFNLWHTGSDGEIERQRESARECDKLIRMKAGTFRYPQKWVCVCVSECWCIKNLKTKSDLFESDRKSDTTHTLDA